LGQAATPARLDGTRPEHAEATEADPVDLDLEHRLARTPEFGHRVLRVIVNGRRTPPPGRDRILRSKEEPPTKLKVDQQADALYLTLGEAPASRTDEVSPGVLVDYDDQDRVVGIETLCLAKRGPDVDLRRLLFESVPQAS